MPPSGWVVACRQLARFIRRLDPARHGGDRDVAIAFAVCAGVVATGALGPHWSRSVAGNLLLFGGIVAGLNYARRIRRHA